MKKALSILILTTSYILANINTVVSILPQKSMVEAIGGKEVTVSVMVAPGGSPHTYEPKPSQMKNIANADIYFAIGVEFERAWIGKFANLNQKMKIIDLSSPIQKIPMQAHHDQDETDEDHHEHGSLDPHIWTAPGNVRIIAEDICDTLSKQDPVNAPLYKKNLDAFLIKIQQTDDHIKQILSTIPNGSAFMVFHPSWGYFANAYGLEQLPVEIEGKEPKPKELVELMKAAKEHHVRAIFTQPEFSDATAKVISEELGIKVIKASPLAPDWSQNLIDLANAIAGK